MESLLQLIGRERSLMEVSQALSFHVRSLDHGAVGALHVTCADETEHECAEAFQHGFVRYLLPSLKFARQSAFRLATLGGRYEWGAVRLADDHFAAAAPAGRGTLVLIKINAHTGLEHDGIARGADSAPFRLGFVTRYGSSSPCCGALHALLAGAEQPAAQELRETFQSEGKDRMGALLDERRVEPALRPLLAALVSARLQARKVVLDVQDYSGGAASRFLVVPAVTLNRPERDTEIVCGAYVIDGAPGAREVIYSGLGDEPDGYATRVVNRLLEVTDDQLGRRRRGRDHRALVAQEWRERGGSHPHAVADERLERVRHDVARNRHRDHHHARALLRATLPILAEVAPVPAAILMFAEGAVGIHHAFRVHRLARQIAGEDEAREILEEIHDRVDRLEPDRAEALIELLMRDYRAG